MATKKKTNYVIVRAYSGVFFGNLLSLKGETAEMSDVKQIHSWNSNGMSEKVNTCGDISVRGVSNTSNVSSAVSRATLNEVKAVFYCTTLASESLSRKGWGT